MNLAALFYNSGRVDEGIQGYRTILEDLEIDSSDRATTENFLGLGLWGNGKKKEAVEALKRSLEADPEQLDSRENLGVFLLALGRHEEARKAFTEVLSRDPKRSRSRYHLLRLRYGDIL